MASLHLHLPDGSTRQFPLVKPITTLGGADSDLPLPGARGVLAIESDGRRHAVSALDGARLELNGKRRDHAELAGGDLILFAKTRIRYEATQEKGTPAPVDSPLRPEVVVRHAGAERPRPPLGEQLRPAPEPQEQRPDGALLVVQRLAELAPALAHEPLDKALARLLDALIEVLRADKGFLLVVEEGVARVQIARSLQRQDLPEGALQLSDSIVSRVLQSRVPLIVSDALHDAEFNSSQSVIDLRLASVLCVPLVRRGELIGLVYLGNDRIASLFTERELTLATALCTTAALLLELALERDELRAERQKLQSQLEEQAYGEIIGSCDPMREVFRKLDKVAGTDISVLVTGETGTGKELIARELHRRSPRKGGPFIAINCGAIPETLLESELFGHVKGAFTGATSTRPGRFQAASGGTLFLDEIGEMSPGLQVKLLRALQDREVVKVGDSRPEPVDLRVVAATNRDLDVELKAGRFREDLYYRINVVGLHLPPLRERGEDAVLLAKWFLGRATRELSSKVKGFSPQALVAILRYRWPGNIRQLENRIRKAVVLAERPLIGPDDLDLRPEQLEPILPLAEARDEWQKRYINEVLDRNGGNRTKTAKDLGVDPRTIFRHLERQEAERRGETLPADEPGGLGGGGLGGGT